MFMSLVPFDRREKARRVPRTTEVRCSGCDRVAECMTAKYPPAQEGSQLRAIPEAPAELKRRDRVGGLIHDTAMPRPILDFACLSG
jgi:hypothetical protein